MTVTSLKDVFRSNVQARLDLLGWDLPAFAGRLGVTARVVEQGLTVPSRLALWPAKRDGKSRTTLEKWARVLNVQPHTLLIASEVAPPTERGLCNVYTPQARQPEAPLGADIRPVAAPLADPSILAYLRGLEGKLNSLLAGQAPRAPVSIDAAVVRFAVERVAHVDSGKLSAARHSNVMSNLDRFARHLGGDRDLRQLGAAELVAYRDAVASKVQSGDLAPAYAHDIMADLRLFIRWAYRREILESLPRCLDELGSTLPAPRIETFPLEMLRHIYRDADDQMRLYLLLMANTGMTQGDISDLTPDHWQGDRIIRKRSKTARWENTPTVSYPLWPLTQQLLDELGDRRGERVLLTRNGSPLKVSRLNAAGRLVKIDAIGRSWGRLMKRLDMPRQPLKLIRKTSASLLAEHPEFGRYAQHFLGHAPASVADRHYVLPSQERFDSAVRWLEGQYGFTSETRTDETE